MENVRHVNPEGLHTSPFFSWAVRVPAGYDTVHLGGHDGVGADGAVVGPGMAEQTRQALSNLRASLEAAGGRITDVVSWTIFHVEGADVQAGVAAFGEVWPREAPPPAITVVTVADVGPPGALVEIAGVAAIPPDR